MQRTAEMEADRADDIKLNIQRKKAERAARDAAAFKQL